jgi:uncharacterized membrane protein
VNLFPWKRSKEFLTEDEKKQLQDAIGKAEMRTSGEIRLFIESKCKYLDAVDRAVELFAELKMFQTKLRNATLVYVAVDDHQVAIFGDEGIHEKVGTKFWQEEVVKMLRHFRENHLADGICEAINDLGEVLHLHFPYNNDTDKNELPDDIVFGK